MRDRTAFPVSVVLRAAVPAAVCRWGLCPRCPGVRSCLSGVYLSSSVGVVLDTRQNAREIPEGGKLSTLISVQVHTRGINR